MKERIAISVILFLTFLVWAPTLSTHFSQDDWVFLSHVYKQPFSAVFKHYQEAFYRPVGQQLFFFLGSRIFGLEAQGFHLLGLLIHLFNIFLLSKLLNIWGCDRRIKYFLLIFYAVNPIHFVALNWLAQVDIEIAVSFGLLTMLFWKKTLLSLGFFAAALLSHETVVMLPIAMAFWTSRGPTSRGPTLIKSAIYFCFGVLLLGLKFLVNPFSPQSDYSLNFNLWQLLSTLKWYGLRAVMIPEGIRNLPVWMIVLSLVPGLILILMFRQRLFRGLGIYFLGALPVLGFGGHLLSAYAVFGVGLMAIELGRGEQVSHWLSRWQKFARSSSPARPDPGSGLGASPSPDLKSGSGWPQTAAVSLANLPTSIAVLVRNLYYLALLLAIGLPSAILIYFNVSNHWSTTRGLISWEMTQKYVEEDSDGREKILSQAKDFENDSEIYFSTMMGRQFEVLERGIDKGIFGWLFYRGNDLTTQFLPDAEFFKNSILAGKFPKWNPWIMAGMPYFLDPQNFLWYPPNYIFLLVPVETGFLLLLIGHLILAGWGVKKILGEFGIFGKLALFGAGMFVLSPKLVGHIEEGNWTLVIAACWLPVLYWALKKNKFWWIAISLSAIIINNLNIGYYSTIFLTLYFLLKSPPDRLSILVKVLVKILVLVILLTIPRWLPLVIFGGQTVRADLQEAPLPVWSWTKIAKSMVLPLAVGHPKLANEEILYLGIVPMGLVLLGILGKLGKLGIRKGVSLLRQGDSLFWSIWLMFIFFVALNNKTPLFYLIKWLPGFTLLRITTRPWIFAALGAALGAPIAIRQIGGIRQIRGIRVSWRMVEMTVLVFSIGILAEFGWFDWKIFGRRQAVSDPVPAKFYRQMAAEGALVRAYCTTGCLDRLTAQRMGVALLGGNNPIQLKSFVQYLQVAGGYKESAYHPILPPYTGFNQKPQPKANLLAETATKFVVSPYELKDSGLELIDYDGEYRLYKNTVDLKEYKEHYFN